LAEVQRIALEFSTDPQILLEKLAAEDAEKDRLTKLQFYKYDEGKPWTWD
jgi:hypothetical protein